MITLLWKQLCVAYLYSALTNHEPIIVGYIWPTFHSDVILDRRVQ